MAPVDRGIRAVRPELLEDDLVPVETPDLEHLESGMDRLPVHKRRRDVDLDGQIGIGVVGGPRLDSSARALFVAASFSGSNIQQ